MRRSSQIDRAPQRAACTGRPIILAALIVVTFLTSVSSPIAAETLRVGKAGREAFSFVPVDVGAQVGIFKKHGLELEISSFGGDARIQQAMAADGIDVALGSGPGLAFIVKGSPIKGIAAMAGPPLLFALMVRADDTVKTVDDLKGRKVGVSTVGSVTSWIVSEVSRQKAGASTASTQVPIGDDASPDCGAANQVDRRRDRQSRRRPQFRPARRRPHPAPFQRSAEGLPRPRDLRDRQGHRGETRSAARLPEGLVRDHRIHARQQVRDGPHRARTSWAPTSRRRPPSTTN